MPQVSAEMKDVQAEMVKWSGIWRSFIPGEKLQEHIQQIKGNKALADQLEGLFKKYAATK